jgi:hypothetical protein
MSINTIQEKIRQNHGALQETVGGCALWTERKWVASIAEGKDTSIV